MYCHTYTDRKKNEGDFQNTWQPPIIASFYDGAKLPLKKKKKRGSSGRKDPMRDVSSTLGGNCLFKLPLGYIVEDILRSFI